MLGIFYVKKTVGFLLLKMQRKHSLLVPRIFLYGFSLSWVYICKSSIVNTLLILLSYVIRISSVSRFVLTKPQNFRDLSMFIKTLGSNSLIYLWKLTSIYIFNLGITHYVLIRAAEVIHISTQSRPQSNFKKIALAPHDYAGNFYWTWFVNFKTIKINLSNLMNFP